MAVIGGVERILRPRTDDVISEITGNYANYLRNDGGGAFRLAAEWLLARFGVLDALGDALIGKAPANLDTCLFNVYEAAQIDHDLIERLSDSDRKRLARVV